MICFAIPTIYDDMVSWNLDICICILYI